MVHLGIDVSKAKLDCTLLLDVQSHRGRSKSVPNTVEGVAALLQWVQRQSACTPEQIRAALEATGAYHEAAAAALYQAGVCVFVANPAQVRDFAKGHAVRTKTDAKDSLVLALFAAQVKLMPWQPAPVEIRELRALMSRLGAVEEQLRAELNRQQKAQLAQDPSLVQQSIEASIAFWQSERERLQRAIDQHIDGHPGLREERERLLSIPAVGDKTANLMLCLLYAGHFHSACQLAAYLGLIPVEHQSGSSVRGRPRLSKNGNARMRAALYMAAVTAIRYNPDVQALYTRLLARGKAKLSALCAAMRKLVHICFGVFKNKQTYRPFVCATP
jgi:transposase